MKERGFTLIEILVVLAVGSMITGAVVSGFFQIEMGTWQIVGKNIAVADMDNTIHWLTRDIPMAQETSLTDGAPPVNTMTLICNDETGWGAAEGSVQHSVTYSLSETQLLRNFDGESRVVGKYISDVDFSISGKTLTVTLTSIPRGFIRSTTTRRFSMFMRALNP